MISRRAKLAVLRYRTLGHRASADTVTWTVMPRLTMTLTGFAGHHSGRWHATVTVQAPAKPVRVTVTAVAHRPA